MEKLTNELIAFLLGSTVSALTTAAILRWFPDLAEDVANERSLHVGVVPRVGGIGIVAAVLVALWHLPIDPLWHGAAGLLALAVVSFLDDRYGLPIVVRLAVHVAAVAFIIATAGTGNWLIGLPVCLAWVWTINLYNFMDGADGLAGGMAAIAFAALGMAFGIAGAGDLAMLCYAIAGAAIGFLAFNLPPARVFLGDTGSISLGFLFGLLAWTGWIRGAWPWWFPAFVILPFLLDATLTLLGRICLRQAFWRAHREHGYQKLVRMGWDHASLLAAAYPLMLFNAAVALAALPEIAWLPEWSLLLVLFLNVAIRAEIEHRWRYVARRKVLIMNKRALAVFVFDIWVVALAWFVAFAIRFGMEVPRDFLWAAVRHVGWIVPIYAVLFRRFGLYRGLWRFASLPDVQQMLLAVSLGAVFVAAILGFLRGGLVPLSVLILHPLITLMVMGGCRFVYRSWKEHHLYGPKRLTGLPVLVLGSGEAAAGLLRELQRSPEWYAVGIIADDPNQVGRRLHNVPVLGVVSEVGAIAQGLDVAHVIIAMPKASVGRRRQVAEYAVAAGLTVMTVPALDEILAGNHVLPRTRRIELEDLLGRDPVQMDSAAIAGFVGGKVVLVTGAGGSIGSELCRQLVRFQPALLIFLEASEFALYRIEQEFENAGCTVPLVCLIGDIKDQAGMNEIMLRYQPQLVFHAAAYKHVPLMESDNAWQAISNNALGTLILARAAVRAGVDKFILISTDKAVNPTSIMGASKRLAEMVCQGQQGKGRTAFITVRFGNVLGSTGSVIPKFKEQIALGGPVTVTHPEMTRYFMLIPEAAQLVLEAARMGKGGEVFVLDMGEPVKIVDLARNMIRLSGFSEREIRIVFTGLRPGEKLYEELLASEEQSAATSHPKVRIANARDVPDGNWDELVRWLENSHGLTVAEIRRSLRRWIPEYISPPIPLKLVADGEVAARR